MSSLSTLEVVVMTQHLLLLASLLTTYAQERQTDRYPLTTERNGHFESLGML